MIISAPTKALSQREFIGLIAMNFAMVAFSIDAMLPALPDIGAQISPDVINRAQLVLTSFVFGMGFGTLFAGPLSDRFGRKPVIFAGTLIFLLGGALATIAQSLETMVIARVIQGLGVAGPRIVTIAIVRDLYRGRQMARIMSYAMLIFTLVPAVAPLVGAGIIASLGWRYIFVACMLFGVLCLAWLMIRQPETLPIERRKTIRPVELWQATRECFGHKVFAVSSLGQVLALGMLFAALSSTQQIFEEVYGRGDSFPLWFALIAILGGAASIINARLVVRLGMLRMVLVGFGLQIIISGLATLLSIAGMLGFAFYLFWATSVFFMAGLLIGNLNTLAMEPLGHIAGLAASVIGSVSTVLSLVIAVPVGLAFDGTTLPLAASLLLFSILGILLMQMQPREIEQQPT